MRRLHTCRLEATSVTTLKGGLTPLHHRRPRMPVENSEQVSQPLARYSGPPRSLEALLASAEPLHPAVRVMNHPYSRVFSLTSLPNAVADQSECAARVSGSRVPDPIPLEYGNGFGMTMRFKTRSGDAPVLRLLWRRENGGTWRVTSYAVELP